MECETCRFYKKAGELSPEKLIVGECKRFPRVFTLEDGELKWLYPLQFGTDCCGEYLKLS